MKRLLFQLVFLILALALAGCAPVEPGAAPEGTPPPPTAPPATDTARPPEPSATPLPSPTPLPDLGEAERKYQILEAFPDFFYCDPDFYPIARADEAQLAVERFPELQRDRETFNAILDYLELAGAADFSPEQQLQIYREYKKLAAIVFEPKGEDQWFQIQVAETEGMGELVTGLIDAQGGITVLERSEAIVSCPICLSAGTRIDTPDGQRPVESLRPGDLVWTLDGKGQRVARPLTAVGRTPAPAGHRVVHLVLEDGREVWLSPGHPTANGRTAGELKAGDRHSGGLVESASLEMYRASATYDLLPASETGFYWANGVLLGSTLAKPGR